MERCADVIESVEQLRIELADVSECPRHLECRADLARASERVEVARVPVLALRASAFRDVESDTRHRPSQLVRERRIPPTNAVRHNAWWRCPESC